MEKQAQISPLQAEFEHAGSFEALAAQQGIGPIEDFEALLGHPAPDDEPLDDFLTLLREWRRDGAPRTS